MREEGVPFGLGIDKADARLVVHWMLPPTLDAR